MASPSMMGVTRPTSWSHASSGKPRLVHAHRGLRDLEGGAAGEALDGALEAAQGARRRELDGEHHGDAERDAERSS